MSAARLALGEVPCVAAPLGMRGGVTAPVAAVAGIMADAASYGGETPVCR